MIIGLIPARYNSSRLPGKPLLKFGEKSMIQLAYLNSIKSKYLNKIYVVTDDNRIKNEIEKIGGNVLIIKDECFNGTDRLCLAIKKYRELFKDIKFVVNIQGDEPYINPNHIDIAIEKMYNIMKINKNVKCSTLHYNISNKNELNNTSIGKLVLDQNNFILYCSRNCIPANKNRDFNISRCKYYGHIGLFVFQIDYLMNNYIIGNTPLQIEEDIEWLKILEQGFQIVSSCVEDYEIGVNTKEDYDYLINKYFSS